MAELTLNQIVLAIVAVVILGVLAFAGAASAGQSVKKFTDKMNTSVGDIWGKMTGKSPAKPPVAQQDPFNKALRRENKYKDSTVTASDILTMFKNIAGESIFEMKFGTQSMFLITTAVSTGQTIFLIMDPVAGELTVMDVVFPKDGIMYTYDGAYSFVEDKKYGILGEYSLNIPRHWGFPYLSMKNGPAQINLKAPDKCYFIDNQEVCLPSMIVKSLNSAAAAKYKKDIIEPVKNKPSTCNIELNKIIRDRSKSKESVLTVEQLKTLIRTLSRPICERCDFTPEILLKGNVDDRTPIYILYSPKTGGVSVINVEYPESDMNCYDLEAVYRSRPMIATGRLFLYQRFPSTNIDLALFTPDKQYTEINLVLPKDLRDAVQKAATQSLSEGSQ